MLLECFWSRIAYAYSSQMHQFIILCTKFIGATNIQPQRILIKKRVSIGRLMTVIGAYTKKNPREIGDFSHAAPLSAWRHNMVRMTGLEPVRPLQAPAPQAGQSTYSSTSANQHELLYQLFFICQLIFFFFLRTLRSIYGHFPWNMLKYHQR